MLGQLDRWITAGAIVFGHANHPTVLHAFDEPQAIIAERGREPVTVDMMFGPTRAYG